MIHHKTWFPIIIVGLTLLLAYVIVSLYSGDLVTETVPQSAVSSVEYKSAATSIVGNLQTDLDTAVSDYERISILENARDGLLGLLVPAEYKDLHLQMVVTLSNWINGYKSDDTKRIRAESEWNDIVNQYYWLE